MSEVLEPGPWLPIHEELGVRPPEFDDQPLGAHIEAHAASIPDNTALQYFDRSISYAELNALANRLANALRSLGVQRNDVVGLHMPTSPQYVVAVIAVSKLGATASGVSTLLSPTELAQQVEDAQVRVLMSLDELAKSTLEPIASFPECVAAVIVTGAQDLTQPVEIELPNLGQVRCEPYLEISETAGDEFVQVELSPEHVSLIQYTGGTTGKPKGAMLTLRGFNYHVPLLHIYRPWEIGKETVPVAFPLFHVGGLGLMLGALRFGARLLLIPDARDLDHFCEQMLKFPPTRIASVPTLYQAIADHPLSKRIDFSGMRNAQTGAAPITGEDRRRIETMLNGVVLSDGFGMTESGPTILVNPPDRCKPESVGLPVPGVDVRIVDIETGTRELPYGEAGEIIAASPALMKGYLNRPEEDAIALREWQGKRWMFTGDVGVMDDEGYVYLKDRAKDMIIVSGFKVFSVEVEDRLASLELIARSALIGVPDPARPGSEMVNLYVELNESAKKSSPEQVRAEILEFCRAEMSAYKIPKVIHLVDEIPLTAVGKIDKKALRAEATRSSRGA